MTAATATHASSAPIAVSFATRVPLPRWGRSAPACLARRGVQALLFGALRATAVARLRVEGAEHLASLRTPALFVANHASHLDTPALLMALPAPIRRRVAVAAAADYFFRDRRVGALATLTIHAFPFVRRGSPREGLAYCGELVDAGWSVLLFPEGTRSETGQIGEFKRGVGLLASTLGVPVVPMVVEGTAAILPKGATRPRPGPVTVRIGPPVHVPAGLDATAATALVRAAVASLAADPRVATAAA
jgi:long-chain acyl-CoA synthetase